MPLDAICLAAVRNELAGQVQGMKIDKVQQPQRDMIILPLRGSGGQTLRLLISAGTGTARVHLTEFKFENPGTPPMFCMLLRKYITGAKIVDITQPQAERVLTLHLETSDALGIRSEMSLIIELIGHQSNVVLKNSENVIVDCLRRIGGGLDDKRMVLPGLIYRDPLPMIGKLNPFSVTGKELIDLIRKTNIETVDKWLLSAFTAFSPLICREITWRAYCEADYRVDAIRDNGEALEETFTALIRQIKSNEYEPWMIYGDKNIPCDFSFSRIMQYEEIYETKREESFSMMLDGYFIRTEIKRRIKQSGASISKLMNNAHKRLVRKLTAQRTELEETSKRNWLRECGDIITTNLHRIKKGQKVLLADDFYSDENKQREIRLDHLKTPQQNAAKYYKAYNKAKNARAFLTEQLQNGEKELDYVKSVIDLIERAETERDLRDIRNELVSTGYIKAHKVQKTKIIESAPLRFLSTNGMRIFAGRNNVQNDKLTLKSASKSDIWLHARKIHGAHVVISCAGTTPDEKTLDEAASIAAYYSSAREALKVPVDYTFVKKVKKTSGGRPGMVIYTDYQTILAHPDGELAKRLLDDS